MPIVAGDIQQRLSGGAANADANLSIGGLKSSVQIVDASLHNLFDVVSGAESLAGDVEYRCFYIHNAHATLAMLGAAVYIDTNSPAAGSDVAIGLGAAAINATETAIANENTAPAGVTFTTPGVGSPLVIGDIPAGQHKAVWVRRTISSGAAAFDTDSVVLGIVCDTAA